MQPSKKCKHQAIIIGDAHIFCAHFPAPYAGLVTTNHHPTAGSLLLLTLQKLNEQNWTNTVRY
jgi:hypothetical protein